MGFQGIQASELQGLGLLRLEAYKGNLTSETRKCSPSRFFAPLHWELRNIYHHHLESKKRKSSEANSGSIQPYGRCKNEKTIFTIAILWPVKAIFEKRAATVEVDTFISPLFTSPSRQGNPQLLRSHLRTPALKTENCCKKSVVLVKRKNGFTKTMLWTENPGKIRRRAS